MNTNRIEVRVNGYKYPQGTFKWDFSDANQDYFNAYQRFFRLGYKHKYVDNGTIISSMILKQCIHYFVLMFQSMDRIFIEVDQLPI